MEASIYSLLKQHKEDLNKNEPSSIVTGLVVQGGGMRGTYSMAALMAIEECGLADSFDHVFGSSAGAINGAYLLANQAKMAVTVYLDDISNENFINLFRLNKIVDIDFLVDCVLKKTKILNIEKLKLSKTILHIMLTDYYTSKTIEVTNKDDIDLMEAIRATAAMPILYNKKIAINGKYYIDGGLTDSVPLLRAIEHGCTDILVVLTRETKFRRSRPNIFMRIIETPFLINYPTETRSIILTKDSYYNHTMDIIESPDLINKPVNIWYIFPSDMKKMVSRTTSDRSRLLSCALMARNDIRRIFQLDTLNDNPFD